MTWTRTGDVRKAPRNNWEERCICACGVEHWVRRVGGGKLRTTGCHACVMSAGRFGLKHGHSAKLEASATYRTWRSMLNRCRLPNGPDYNRYGGRGIRVCERWGIFENFLADMGERPPGRTIDRRDNDGNYTPENCRWATRTEQQRNRRACRLVTVDGLTATVAEWAERTGIPAYCIYQRLHQGWDPARSVTTPRRTHPAQAREQVTHERPD